MRRVLLILLIIAISTTAFAKKAIMVTAFGTSTKAAITFNEYEADLKNHFKGYDIKWAYTSSFIRAKVNKRNKKNGNPERLYAPDEMLKKMYADGYSEIYVHSLHVFPGTEWDEMQALVASVPKPEGVKVAISKPLLTWWHSVELALKAVEKHFNKNGATILITHGTPETNHPVTGTYLGVQNIVEKNYKNVFVNTVEGVLPADASIEEAAKINGDTIHLVPFLFVAGDHVMNDVMGDDPQEPSMKMKINKLGKKVYTPTVTIDGKEYYEGMGLNPEIRQIYFEHLMKRIK